jgi:GNAT superfamily N-acetyltransferase
VEALPLCQIATLRDGSSIHIRPICPEDAPRLQALHSRLSPQSIRLRFMALHMALAPAEADRLANVDFDCRMAFVATRPSAAGEAIVGVARYALLGPDKPGVAEAAVVVEDRYQGLGAGPILIDCLLAYAREHGVRTFVADVSQENERMLRFIRRCGLPAEMTLQAGTWQVRIDIAATTAAAREPVQGQQSQ